MIEDENDLFSFYVHFSFYLLIGAEYWKMLAKMIQSGKLILAIALGTLSL